jgi:hypothetical protein
MLDRRLKLHGVDLLIDIRLLDWINDFLATTEYINL